MDGFPSSTAQNSFEGGSSEFTSTVPIFDGSLPVNSTSIRGLTRYFNMAVRVILGIMLPHVEQM